MISKLIQQQTKIQMNCHWNKLSQIGYSRPIQHNKSNNLFSNSMQNSFEKYKINQNFVQTLRQNSRQKKFSQQQKQSQLRTISTPTSASQQIPQPQSRAPQPIPQTKINKSHYQLNSIQVCRGVQKIQQLYLSHNKICSVKKVLRKFSSLRNLNLSYNLLSNVKQFVDEFYLWDDSDETITQKNEWARNEEIVQIQNNRNMRIKLKMLNIRMNKFAYGYEDTLVRTMPSLQKLEDYVFLSKQNISKQKKRSFATKKSNQVYIQDRDLLFSKAGKVSQYFLPSYLCLMRSITILTNILHTFSQQEEYSQYFVRKRVIQRYEHSITKLSQLLEPRNNKEITYLPQNRIEMLNNIMVYQMACIGLNDHRENSILEGFEERLSRKRNGGYHQQNYDMFKDIVSQILMHFNNRNHYELIKTLENDSGQQSQSHFTPHQTDIDELVHRFGVLYGGRKYSVYQPNPAKHIQMINTQLAKDHTLPAIIMHKNTIDLQDRNTLSGDRVRSKNVLIRQMEKHCQTNSAIPYQMQSNKEIELFQNLPIIIFERNYLQIIFHIWQDKMRQIIKVYDLILRKLPSPQTKSQPIFIQPKIKHLQNQSIQLSSNAYLKNQQNNPKQNNQFIQITKDSQKCQNIDKPSQNNQAKINKLSMNHQEEILYKESIQSQKQDRTTIQKKPNIIQGKKFAMKKQRPTLYKNQQYSQNLNKYNLYQINLAYKVLRVLKKNKKRKQKNKKYNISQTHVQQDKDSSSNRKVINDNGII